MKKILILVMVLALVAVLALPLTALAADNGSTNISGDVGDSIELTPPTGPAGGAISLGVMAIGVNTASQTVLGTIKTNHPTGCEVDIASNKTDGRMQIGTTTKLNNPLLVTTSAGGGGAGVSGQAVTTTSNQQVATYSGIVDVSISLSVSQTVIVADAIGTGYAITLTYTATEH